VGPPIRGQTNAEFGSTQPAAIHGGEEIHLQRLDLLGLLSKYYVKYGTTSRRESVRVDFRWGRSLWPSS
jgi:hypothetical protein